MYPREFFDTFWRNDIRDEVFVAMPYHDEFIDVWEKAIKPGIENNGKYRLEANRVDVTNLSGSILTSIFDGIAHSKVVLADISIAKSGKWARQRNGNVMYEVGLAHALRHSSEIVLIKSDPKPASFDIMSIVVHPYDRDDFEQTRARLCELIINVIESIEATKTLIIEKAVASINTPAMTNLAMYGPDVGYSIWKPKDMGDDLGAIKEYLALQFLVERSIMEFAPERSDRNQDFYVWTAFGKALLERLGIR